MDQSVKTLSIETCLMAVRESLREFFVLHLRGTMSLGATHRNEGARTRFELSAIVMLSGAVTGRAVISLPGSTAQQVARRLLGEAALAPGVTEDCAGEIANVIFGRAKTDFGEGGISISPPVVVSGNDYQIQVPRGAECLSLPIETSFGPGQIELAIRNGE